MSQERRLVPRYSCSGTVQVGDERGRRFSAESRDVSLNGMAVLLSREAVLALAQSGGQLMAGDSLLVSLDGDGAETAELWCRTGHVRRISRAECHVGLWFTGLEPAEEARLQEWISSHCG